MSVSTVLTKQKNPVIYMNNHIYILHCITYSLCLLLKYCVCSYVRAEVLAGFVNGLFLVFISFFIFSESVEVTAVENVHCF